METFNAVIEGTYHDEWRNLHYIIAHLEFPEGATALNDGSYKYMLHGTTTDFKTLKPRPSAKSLEAAVDFVPFCPGIVLPYRGGVWQNILERPRTICMRDGRVFVDDHMLTDNQYLKVLRNIMENAHRLFRDEKVSELFRRIMVTQQ